ncbi:ubiquinone/menaquinone biosynthesis C-methylase UbiE [Lipingzhangella halophila]|uniref:Ubiquinone/menaquinone biosynthesis C-methylase UbiE n=1 Tax=Lipingzhangella halophila TaxID=1783352 RepID=A0A7W7W624_9ACTN|nr:class I SAM-dependent methyltransferase [Lipingzhangella halophila]MBB4934440.1 ubiquinone/menaquinone biosynthesis C-methylase UbiE [Lipingzhangella halophila]
MSDTPQVPVSSPNPGLYRPWVLRFIYGPVVIGISHPLVWGVSNRSLRHLHASRVGPTHVEVGPGNGHLLARLPRRTPMQRLELLDLNPACLHHTQRRLRRRAFAVHTHQANALDPWPLASSSVDSVSAMMVLHTLPGETIAAKALLVREAARVLKPGRTLVGCTILARGVSISARAERLMDVYNSKNNTFHNTGDSLGDLTAVLKQHFPHVTVRTQGCVAVWEATK